MVEALHSDPNKLRASILRELNAGESSPSAAHATLLARARASAADRKAARRANAK